MDCHICKDGMKLNRCFNYSLSEGKTIKKAIWVCTNSKCKAKMVIEADIDAHKGAWKIGKIFGDLR